MMTLLVPLSPDKLSGPFANVSTGFDVKAQRDKAPLSEFHERPADVAWFNEFELLYCRQMHDTDQVNVIRKATDDERNIFRVPTWIQDEETSDCCGQPMFFIGQIDDDKLCTEKPKGAKKWWHDSVSFYVFTCPKCLECKAVGQQF